MHTIAVDNVNEALPCGVRLLQEAGVRRKSRNGDVIMADKPVTTTYYRPWERVLLYPERDANPFFHVFESIWMLGGRNDVRSVARYVSRMRTYSDDGHSLHGAYGFRWRKHFVQDQLEWAVRRLKQDPNDRRVVIGMWDPNVDMERAGNGGKDVPCNTQIYVFVTTDNKLSITVCCRSNDMVWGAYGANAVHFSFLQEYIANSLGLEMGPLWQMSNNFHAYMDTFDKVKDLAPMDPYKAPDYFAGVNHIPLINTERLEFDQDIMMMLDEDVSLGLRNMWLRKVLHPIMMSHKAYARKEDPERFSKALEVANQIQALDWRYACLEWLKRRQLEAQKASDDGVSHE